MVWLILPFPTESFDSRHTNECVLPLVPKTMTRRRLAQAAQIPEACASSRRQWLAENPSAGMLFPSVGKPNKCIALSPRMARCCCVWTEAHAAR